jgi:tetraacyldisaccharide 4'-kinase
MLLNKPKFWDKKNSLLSILFFPISLIVLLYIFLKKKLTRIIKFNIPVICVGNIYVGGTGKTPTSILLANELSRLNKKPVILRKYYENHIDEHRLIKESFKSLILNKDRAEGIREAEEKKYDSIILDDGFQDYKIKKDLSILCFNENQLIGNGLILPSGPLRESLNSLKNADLILINGKKNTNFEKKILYINKKLKIFYSNYKPKNLDKFKNKKLMAVAGIGNPNNFFKLIKENGLDIERKLIFPDHYKFTQPEVENIVKEANLSNYQLITTEKDYYKLKDFAINKIDYLKVSLEINEKEKFLKQIVKLYEKKN